MDHPRGIVSSSATPQEQAERAAERADTEKARQEHFKQLLEAVKMVRRMAMTKPEPTQREKFEQATVELECNDDEARFDERVRKLVKHKPVPERPE